MENTNSNWQDLRPRERMEYLLKTGHLSDCSFVVYDDEGKKIVLKCHKFVLMSVSPVFERMFEGDFEESKIPDNIVLDDVSGNDFKKFIEYLYWHDNRRLDTFDLVTLQTLIYLSKKFMVSFMTNNCLGMIKRRLANGLDPDVTIDLFEYAFQIDDRELIASLLYKFRSNPDTYIGRAAVFDLSSEMFLKFIDGLATHVGDKQRFDVIERYCKIQGLVEDSRPSTPESVCTENCDHTNTEEEDDEEVQHFLVKRVKEDDKKKLEPIKLETKNTEESQTEVPNEKDENQNEVDKETTLNSEEEAKENTDTPELEEKKKREQEQKTEYIQKLLKTINFTSMTAFNFCSGPGLSNLLTVEQKFEILSRICVADHKMLMLRLTQERKAMDF